MNTMTVAHEVPIYRPFATEIDGKKKQVDDDLELPGRYLILGDDFENACVVSKFTSSTMTIKGPRVGKIGDRAILYIKDLGRVEGRLIRVARGWFRIEVVASLRKRARLEATIAWLVKRHKQEARDLRAEERVYIDGRQVPARTETGQEFIASMVDMSVSGAGILTDIPLPVGTPLILDGCPAVVVRTFDRGVGVHFHTPYTIARRYIEKTTIMEKTAGDAETVDPKVVDPRIVDTKVVDPEVDGATVFGLKVDGQGNVDGETLGVEADDQGNIYGETVGMEADDKKSIGVETADGNPVESRIDSPTVVEKNLADAEISDQQIDSEVPRTKCDAVEALAPESVVLESAIPESSISEFFISKIAISESADANLIASTTFSTFPSA